MEFDVDTLRQQIPYYLTSGDRRTLIRELRDIASGGTANYFLSPYNDTFKDHVLQGDGWRGFQLFHFTTGKRRSVKGLVLSNSCDIDLENQRDMPTRIIFAPLVKLAFYRSMLEKANIDKMQVANKINSIKAQKTTNIFYLPADGPLEEEHIVRLDTVQSMPVAAHRDSSDREKLFRLSSTGFYMLIFKLSVHFCRFQENINRNAGITPA